MNKISIAHVSNSHSSWLRALDFYKTELKLNRNILTEIAGKNTGKDMMKQVEHYENLFTLHTNNIDGLAHDINVNVSELGKEAYASSAGYVDANLNEKHHHLNSRVETEENEVQKVVRDFRRFAATWM